MHFTVMAAVAAEHQADLLRAAERRRQVAAHSHPDARFALAGAVDRVAHAALRLRHKAAAPFQQPAEPCCA